MYANVWQKVAFLLLRLEIEFHEGLDAVVEYPVKVGRRVFVSIRFAVMDGGEHILDTELQFAEVVDELWLDAVHTGEGRCAVLFIERVLGRA